jgi:hypothetical protein
MRHQSEATSVVVWYEITYRTCQGLRRTSRSIYVFVMNALSNTMLPEPKKVLIKQYALNIISADFDVTGQLLIIYSAFVKYLKKMAIQWGSASAIYRLQESLWFS